MLGGNYINYLSKLKEYENGLCGVNNYYLRG